MIITRVLNNNTVLTTDENGDEIVLLGAGLGFKKKPGDTVDGAHVEKRFILKGKANQSSFETLINAIPDEYILLAEKLISMAKSQYQLELSESIHISLADHIHSAVENLRLGITIPNPLTLEIRQFYANEYAVARRGLALVREELGVDLPEDEAGFIAMHFITAATENTGTTANELIGLVRDLDDLIRRTLNVVPDRDALNYHRYMIHLKFFAQRILKHYHFESDDMGDLDSILTRYPREYECSQVVARYVEERYGYEAGYDEILFLTVHLARLTQPQ